MLPNSQPHRLLHEIQGFDEGGFTERAPVSFGIDRKSDRVQRELCARLQSPPAQCADAAIQHLQQIV